jgi:hypothetical protein
MSYLRSFKMLGLAMVAAIAAMAVIGVGTASATLCKTNAESTCSEENTWGAPTTIVVHSAQAVLKSNFIGETKCLSAATLVHEKTEGTKLIGTLTSLKWEGCEGCKKAVTTSLNGTGKTDDEATGGGNGKVTFLGKIVVELTECPLGVKCVATAENASMSLDGGTINGTALGLATNVKVALAGTGCGTEATWNANGTTGKPYTVKSVNGETSGSIFVL